MDHFYYLNEKGEETNLIKEIYKSKQHIFNLDRNIMDLQKEISSLKNKISKCECKICENTEDCSN